jgi:hypothetical protein
MYRPLPEYLTIRSSEIEGLGLFTKDRIDSSFRIGITHVKDTRFQDSYIRTPLGGFFNHSSESPNCKVVYEDDFIFLETIREISPNEELTARYTIYTPIRK